jgi:hypothetical protein
MVASSLSAKAANSAASGDVGFCGELLTDLGLLAERVETRLEGGNAFLEPARVEVGSWHRRRMTKCKT